MRQLKKLLRCDQCILGGALLFWSGLILLGSYVLLSYDNRPGEWDPAPQYWPQTAALVRDPHKFTLLMTVHPKCGCSRASLGELSRLLSHHGSKVSTNALFILPIGADKSWLSATELWQTAQSLPNLRSIRDVDGQLAKLFGAKTSGYTLLYDKAGKLVFHGGITASRGHWGDNAGSQAIAAILSGQRSDGATVPFGCHLFRKKDRGNES